MSRSEDDLIKGLDSRLSGGSESLRHVFINVTSKVRGRASHTYGVGARGIAECVSAWVSRE